MRFESVREADAYLIAIVLLVCACFLVPSAMRFMQARNMGEAIATVTMKDKAGKERTFRVAEFEESSPSYTRFKTVDGRIIEIVENEVRMK